MSSREQTPLLSSAPSNGGGESSTFYFVGKINEDYQGGRTQAVRDADGQQVVEGLPPGTSEQEFAPRPLAHHKVRTTVSAKCCISV
jgi:hypothetical protein